MTSDQDLRDAAKKSIKKKRGAWQFLITTLVVFGFMNVIWAVATPGESYWPIWVLFGMGIGVVFAFLDAYTKFSNKEISDAQIDAEVKKMKG
ncbi:MAG: hypothetical protein RLZZ600_380 [Actinomycetota bacterium]|jgi:hypothetical protein